MNTRKYQVNARDWDKDLQDQFGKRDSLHNLSDDEVIELIIQFGRAEILRKNKGSDEFFSLEFQNAYD